MILKSFASRCTIFKFQISRWVPLRANLLTIGIIRKHNGTLFSPNRCSSDKSVQYVMELQNSPFFKRKKVKYASIEHKFSPSAGFCCFCVRSLFYCSNAQGKQLRFVESMRKEYQIFVMFVWYFPLALIHTVYNFLSSRWQRVDSAVGGDFNALTNDGKKENFFSWRNNNNNNNVAIILRDREESRLLPEIGGKVRGFTMVSKWRVAFARLAVGLIVPNENECGSRIDFLCLRGEKTHTTRGGGGRRRSTK